MSTYKKIHLRKIWNNHKIKECEKIVKKVEQVLYSVVSFWNFVALLALYCYFGGNVKYRLLSKRLLKRKQQHGG